MKSPLKSGFATLRIQRLSALHARAHAAAHARDDHDLNWLCGREKAHREQIGALALEAATMRERVAALEAEVARLTTHHPAPAPKPAPPTVLDVVRRHPDGINAAKAVHAAYPDGIHPVLADSVIRELQARGLVEVVRDARTGEAMLYPTPASDLSGLAAWSSR